MRTHPRGGRDERRHGALGRVHRCGGRFLRPGTLMRVLHLLDAAVARPTDYGRRAQALLAALRAQGVQTVHVATQAEGARPASVDAACWPPDWHLYQTGQAHPPRWLPSRHAAGYTLAVDMAALAARLRHVARLTRPDLIHVHGADARAAAAWPVARLARLPLVVDAERRGARPRGAPVPMLERFLCARADAIAAPSIEMRAVLRADGMRGRRIAILPPAADVAAAPRSHAGPPGLEGAPLLAYAGPLERAGGIDLLLAVVRVLRREYPALRLLVAGAGTAALDERVDRLGLRGFVVCTGRLSGRRAADALARADIAVFPALAGSAAALAPSRHLLNAMAQGCTIVASDLACHRDLLVHGHSGMLFPAGCGVALIKILKELLGARRGSGVLGEAASAVIAARHSWTAAAAGYRRLYEAVLTDAPSGRR
jgi:glycosyltransferase involved in cell wall biosynthesis